MSALKMTVFCGWRMKMLVRCLVTFAGLMSAASFAGMLPENVGGSTRIESSVVSVAGLRDKGLIKQALDYSCGAAALATLLTHQWKDEVSEKMVLKALLKITPEDVIEKRRSSGLTLLDLQRLALAFGYKAAGLRANIEQLQALKVPVIVYIEPAGYDHFSVLRGIRNGRAYLADPSRGNVSYPLYQFKEMWAVDGNKGVLLAVEPPQVSDALIAAGTLDPEAGPRPGLQDARSRMPFSGLTTPMELMTPR